MALEESLNVKLVLIPGNEDPDSYVRKVGTNAFKDFVASNKKDFVLFQSEVLLKEAGTDVNKKNEAVNHIAETISKINKAEDFTKQQEYIRQCASLLKIDETGFTNLVNKFIRDKISKEEKKLPQNEARFFETITNEKNEQAFDNAINLLLEDEYQEREVVKRLIEYGNCNLNEEKHVADVIFEVLEQYHLNNNKLEKITEAYHQMLQESGYIDSKTFLYSNNTEQNAFVAGLLNFPYELHDWSRRMEGYTVKLDNDIHTVINSALNMYKLRKIKRMYIELEDELMKEKEEEKYIGIIKIYEYLKQIERDITKEMHTVYLK